MSTNTRMLSIACALALTVAMPAWAASGDGAGQAAPATAPLQLEWDARLRQEQVSDDAFERDADASTLRLRMGLRASFGDGWSGLLEGAGVAGVDGRYNSGANRRTAYPTILDPLGSQLNQAWLAWKAPTFGATLGRQRIVLDNQCWVGNSGWRQFEQTFDALALQWQPAQHWTLGYDWLGRVHRVAGPDAIAPLARTRKLDTSLFNAAYVTAAQSWVGYAYLHQDRDVRTASTATYGVRCSGLRVDGDDGFGWSAEYARQSDYANNSGRFAVSYGLLEPTWTFRSITTKLGWEYLGSDGQHALQTPLATLHGFNGWDDQFNVTPMRGLQDRYLGVIGPLGDGAVSGKLTWSVAYHDYRAARGGRYGSEWNASFGFPLLRGLDGLVKLANYRADGFNRDGAKLWLQLEWKGQQAMP